MNAALHIVVGRDGRVACKGWRGQTGSPFVWGQVDARQVPPDYLMTWETAEGAQKFANMNGGNVTTVMEFFYSPVKNTGT